ncbi:hypothetical protein ACFV5I_00005, partial [Streptomyces sp. NPDC059759]
MNKVMTRTRRHPGGRPPGRQDSRRPGSTPPRTPGAGTPARPPGGGPPPGPVPSAPPSAVRAPEAPHGGARPSARPRPTDVFAERLLAVLSGTRPVHCMLRHTAGRAYDELVWLAERGALRARGNGVLLVQGRSRVLDLDLLDLLLDLDLQV